MNEPVLPHPLKLGFGFMRIPRLPGGSADMDLLTDLADRFLSAGGTYFDTAYTYGKDGDSETSLRDAVVRRYPRERFTIATKVNAGKSKDEEDAKAQLLTSLKRLECGYIDCYLLHGVQIASREKYDSWHLWDYLKEKKEEGLIRNIGFSFHSSPEMLEELLNEHPEVDFVQLQINYADWNNANVNSRGCYEAARNHGVPIVVMEPVKGGGLASPNPSVQKILKDADPLASFASWAIRFAAGLEGVRTVLSGMNTIEQMEDNLSVMKDFHPLSASEQEVIERATEALKEDNAIACTACRYCTPGCPVQISIPEVFAAMNEYLRYHDRLKFRRNYGIAVRNGQDVSLCLKCGQCEQACPQHLPIIPLLRDTKQTLEELFPQ